MDPLTALSVATSVVSFVDFGSKLLSKSRKLYKSSNGVLTENVDLHVIALDIATLAQGLQRKLPEHRPLSNPSKGSATFEDDGALDHMCRRCVEIASELMAHLDKLKVDAPSTEKEKKGKKNKKAENEIEAEKDKEYTKEKHDENDEKTSDEVTDVSVKAAKQSTLPTSGPPASKTQGGPLSLLVAMDAQSRQLTRYLGCRTNSSLLQQYYQQRVSALSKLEKLPKGIGSIVEKAGDRGLGGYPARVPGRN